MVLSLNWLGEGAWEMEMKRHRLRMLSRIDYIVIVAEALLLIIVILLAALTPRDVIQQTMSVITALALVGLSLLVYYSGKEFLLAKILSIVCAILGILTLLAVALAVVTQTRLPIDLVQGFAFFNWGGFNTITLLTGSWFILYFANLAAFVTRYNRIHGSTGTGYRTSCD